MEPRPRTPRPEAAFRAVVAACVVAFGGCGDATGPRDDRLTDAEVRALLDVLQRVGTLETGVPTAPSPAIQASSVVAPAQALAPVRVDLTRSCPEGGSLQVNGAINADSDPSSGTSHLTVDLVKVHRSCTATAANGQTFRLDGDPNLQLKMDLSGSGGTLGSLRGTVVGSLHWSSGDRSGRCQIDLLLELSTTAQGGTSGLLSGNFCELDVGGPVSG